MQVIFKYTCTYKRLKTNFNEHYNYFLKKRLESYVYYKIKLHYLRQKSIIKVIQRNGPEVFFK